MLRNCKDVWRYLGKDARGCCTSCDDDEEYMDIEMCESRYVKGSVCCRAKAAIDGYCQLHPNAEKELGDQDGKE
jgi:hypothetical protein